MYYDSFTGQAQNSGAYIFRPQSQEATAFTATEITMGPAITLPGLQEVHQVCCVVEAQLVVSAETDVNGSTTCRNALMSRCDGWKRLM
jgi:hypothetical protein